MSAQSVVKGSGNSTMDLGAGPRRDVGRARSPAGSSGLALAILAGAVAYVLKSYERGRYDDSTIWVFPVPGAR